MKLKAYFWLVILSFSFVFGGLYITAIMNRVVANLHDISVFQHMEVQRKELLCQIKGVQTDLLLMNTHHALSQDTIARHEEGVVESIRACSSCHHPEAIAAKIANLQAIFVVYQEKMRSFHSLGENDSRLPEAERSARNEEKRLQAEIDRLLLRAEETVSTRIGLAKQDIAASRELLLLSITIGPLLILLFSLYYFSRFTRAVSCLSLAFKKVKEGSLDYRIEEKLDDEFQQLAIAFNDMNISLKEQGKQVESLQQRYQLLFESVGDSVFILEAEGADPGKIVSANKAAADIHGYSIDELLGGMRIQDLDEPEGFAKAPERIRRMLNGEWLKFQVNHRKKDGTVFPVEVSAGLLEYDGHKYIMAFDRDITSRVKGDEALQRARQLAMVGEMAAGLAHEIKNPLAGIKVSIEVLAGELALDQEDKEVFIRVIQEVNRIETLLKNLLNYARPPKPNFEAVDLNALLAISVKHAELTLNSPNYFSEKKKEITFHTELASDLPPVQADSSQLQQIFLNLLLNSIEAISEAGSITVRTGRDQAGHVLVTIADTGKGFSEEGLLKVFQPFYTTKSKGSGLGMAITKRLVELNHGHIELISGKGEGAVFVVTFKVKHRDGGAEE